MLIKYNTTQRFEREDKFNEANKTTYEFSYKGKHMKTYTEQKHL